jgi:multidrug resistance efflux pump
MNTAKPYWHPWHTGGPVWMMTDAERDARLVTINTHKPEAERPTRLALFQPVKVSAARDKALAAYDKALAAFDKARAAFDKARAALDKARAALDKARAALDKARAAIIALHTAECRDAEGSPCKWTPEQPNIFADQRP